LQNNELQVTGLKDKLQQITGSFDLLYGDAQRAGLEVSNPLLFQRVQDLRQILHPDDESHYSMETPGPSGPMTIAKRRSRTISPAQDTSPNAFHLPFGFVVEENTNVTSSATTSTQEREAPEAYSQNFEAAPYPLAQGKLSGFRHSYSFYESTFNRRLLRHSLEYAFGLFSEPQLDIQAAYRIFRLVGCMQDRLKMYPYFRRLVRAGGGEALEIPTLPFYSIGGAGTHYPLVDETGTPISQRNTRLPGRILNIDSRTNSTDAADLESHRAAALEAVGLGGEWFDCRDVEGFLEWKGVAINSSLEFPRVYPSSRQIVQTCNMHNCKKKTSQIYGGPSVRGGAECVEINRPQSNIEGAAVNNPFLREYIGEYYLLVPT
jgi:hypothetical protein